MSNPSSKSLAALLLGALIMPALAADPQAARYYEDALVRYDKDDVAGAVIQLKNALKSDPQMLAAHVLLGKALLASGDPVGAEVALDTALKLGVNRMEVAVPLGQAYLLQGKYAQLLENVTTAGLPTGLQSEVLILRANAEAEKGNAAAALKTLEEARSLDPRSAAVLVAQATVLIRTGDLGRASTAVDEALRLAPEDPVAWNTRASILHVRGDLPGALAAYGKASALKPKYLDPRITRAGLLLDMKRLEEADREVAEVLAIQPLEARGHYLKSVIAAQRGNKALAKASLEEITKLLDPLDPAVLALNKQMLLLAGLAHFELGNREKAVDKLSAYLKRYPGERGPTKLLASLYLDRGDRALAMSLLEPLLRASPNDPRALSLLATAYMQDRNYRRASELLEQAVKVSGDASDIRTDFGLSLVGAGKAASGIDQLSQAFAKDPKQVRAGIALTTLHLRSGQPKQALEVIDKVVKGDPENLAALNLLGIVRVAAGDRAGGRKAYEQVLARDSGYQGAILNLARLDLAEGRIDAARQRLTKVVQTDLQNVEVMAELAVVEEKAGKLSEAVRWLEKARAVPKGALRAGMQLAELHLRTGNTEPALTVARELTAKAPDNLAVLGLLTRIQLAKGDSRSAQQTLKDMTRYANYDSVAQFEIARLQVAAGNETGAAYSLDKALSSRPDFLPALVLFAEIDIRRKEFAKAEQRIRAIGEKFPASGLAARLQGDLAMGKGQYPAAQASYQAALRKENSAETALRLFGAHFKGGEMAKGVAFLEKWLKDHPDNLAVLRAIGDGHFRLGHLAEARQAYDRLRQLRPDDALVLNNLALVAFRQKDRDAIALAERAYALRPNDPVVIDTLGWILVRQGQLDRGIGLLRDARLREPGNPEIRYHLAVALNQSGRKAEARDELAEALKSGTAFEGSDEARRLQAELAGTR